MSIIKPLMKCKDTPEHIIFNIDERRQYYSGEDAARRAEFISRLICAVRMRRLIEADTTRIIIGSHFIVIAIIARVKTLSYGANYCRGGFADITAVFACCYCDVFQSVMTSPSKPD